MGEGVVADVVPLGEDAAREIGRGGDIAPDHEEGGVKVALLELVENAVGDAGRRAVVEGERDAVAVSGPAA